MVAEKKKGLGTKEWCNEGRGHKGEGKPKWNRMKHKTLDSWVVITPSLKKTTVWACKDANQRQSQERVSTTSGSSSPSVFEKKQCNDATATSGADFKNCEGRVSNSRNLEDPKIPGICLPLNEEGCFEQKGWGAACDIAPLNSLSEERKKNTVSLGSSTMKDNSCEIHNKSKDLTESKGEIQLLGFTRSLPSETHPSCGSSMLGLIEKARRDALCKQPPSLPSSGKKAAAKRPRPPQSAPQAPLRRSTRRVGGKQVEGRDILPSVTQVVQIIDDLQSNTEHNLEEFHDSGVLKYVVEPDVMWRRRSMIPAGWEERGIQGLRLIGGPGMNNPLSTGALGAIYSMDLRMEEGLITAGGKGGILSVMSITGQKKQNINETGSDEGDESTHLEPLLCFKGHSGWISGVKMLHLKGNSSLCQMITTSNDGFMKLWDVSKVCGGIPHVLQTFKPHKGGIFCMHASGLTLATGGKDKAVVVSTLCNEGGISVHRDLDKLHTAVVKDVQWRDECCLASCGDDRMIQMSDLREKEGGRIGAIRLDEEIKLWDLRNISAPSKVLMGHVSPYVRKIKSIRHPEFYAGNVVLIGGEGSGHLTLYSVDTGNTVSHGELRKSGDVLSLATSAYDTAAASVADDGIYLLGPELNS